MKRRVTLSVCWLLVVPALYRPSALVAAKPAPAPVPAGKILYVHYSGTPSTPVYFEMNGDGSNKTQTASGVPADPRGIPSQKTYFGHRWWLLNLTTPATQVTDLYATDGTRVVQLTAGGERDNGDGTETLVRYPYGAIWSNNGAATLSDTYIGFWGLRRIRDKTTKESIEVQHIFYRLDLSAWELETSGQAALTPVFDGVFDTAPRLAPVLKTPVRAPSGFFGSAGACFSPDGTRLAFAAYYDNSDNGADLYVADISNVATEGAASTTQAVKLFENAGTWGVRSVDWSRTDDPAQWRIAYVANGHLYTVRPDNTGLRDVVPAGAYPDFVSWSPDDQHLAFRLETRQGLYYYYNIARVSAAGGSVVNLTSDTNKNETKALVGWRP